ncbi:hypothetical protein [Xanthomonas axonopodis]
MSGIVVQTFLREALKKDTDEQLLFVPPLRISNFSLYGQPIEAIGAPGATLSSDQPQEVGEQPPLL